MILLILIVLLIVFFVGCILMKDDDHENLGCGMSVFGGVFSVAALIVTIVLISQISCGSVIDEKIALYEETNAKIEEHINDVVTNYKSYENDTYEKFNGSNGTEVVSLYPELKADELIQKQMEIYHENQSNILTLKSDKIGLKLVRWWLYFGN